MRPFISLYVGGMGAKGQNFHYEVFARMGFEAECERIQESYFAGDKAAAAAQVTNEMVQSIALVGPRRQDPRGIGTVERHSGDHDADRG